MNFCTKRLRFL